MAKKKASSFLLSSFLSFLSFLHAKPLSRKTPTTLYSKLQHYSSLDKNSNQVVVCDVEGGLLRSQSKFPYFMLVALEGGGLLRGLLLLVLYPLLCCVSDELGLKIMVFVSFCGIKKKGFRVGRSVLPKFFLEDVGLEGFEALNKGSKKVCVSEMPRVMVEGFLKDYLEVDVVIGRELKEFHGYYTGFMEEEAKVREGFDLKELIKIEELKDIDIVGFSSSTKIYLVGEKDKRVWHPLPREKHPRPLIFHDGRIAFKPTPTNTTFMFMWLPFGLILAILRLIIGVSLPYKVSTPVLALTGMKWRLKGVHPSNLLPQSSSDHHASKQHGQLYVCNHRTLIDPIYVSIMLNKPVRAVTYSLSRVSEILSPIKTVRLTRNREKDGNMMAKKLSQGESVVVCPEGTTCREPYLLRFSPLFTELSDEIVPVALNVHVSMFYATTAGGSKSLDPLYYLMNPSMCYEVELLEKVDTSVVRKGECSSIDMANHVQREIGKALGFECTMLTRKDKYMILAGNDGSVAPPK
ncbi:putative glycerol-3-phosphate acyltransferase 3 [Ananas comosus]|uniref:Putative glycerol-3-phosphate acyltransferase 3 n=1 Tax=Ananas comosus TaxID=4615 RepID=A0A199UWB9_ANACO|nr:putative glycerol-3-phosphate acyltransferase 3 [Ananas comosus]